jgi:small subunit ribosomal protein S16
MLIIRLQRVGKKNDPSFRIVLTDSRRAPRSGGFIEILGSYNAQQGEPQFKKDRIEHWLKQGIQTSDSIHNLFVRNGILKAKKRDVSSKKNVGEKSSEATVAATPTAA